MTELEKMNHVADALGRQAAEFQKERDDLRDYIAGISEWLPGVPGEVLLAVKVKRLIEERDQLKAQLAQIDASGSLTAAIERAKRDGAVDALTKLEANFRIASPGSHWESAMNDAADRCVYRIAELKAANA